MKVKLFDRYSNCTESNCQESKIHDKLLHGGKLQKHNIREL